MFSFKTNFYTTLAFFSLTLSLNAQFKYLFTSDRWIGETYAVSRETKQGLKLKGNPLITADKPWEGGVNCFGSVLYDEGKFRMWYQIYNGKEKKDLRFATMVGYAESTDGINWIKPELGLHEYLGSKNNNIVLPSWGFSDLYSPAVVKDLNEKDPSKRYKMLYWDAMTRENVNKYGSPYPAGNSVPGWTAIAGEGFFVAFSPDGIRWQRHGTQPVFTCACDASALTQNADGSFTAYFKLSDKDDRHFRELGSASSNDFINWTEPKKIMSPDWKDPYGTEFYGVSVSNYFGNQLGLIWMYYNSPNDKGMDVQLAEVTADQKWERSADRKIILPMGQNGDWDAGAVIPAADLIVSPQVAPNEIYIYYGGATTRHDDSRAYHRENSIGLATMRLDGFAAMEAKFFQGFLKTLPVQFSKRLFVNADAKKGFLQCELIDPETGKSVATSKKLAHFDSVKQGIEWENNFKPEDKKYILKFNMQKAGIYAFWFE